jgi:large subunit ribosomal protein L28
VHGASALRLSWQGSQRYSSAEAAWAALHTPAACWVSHLTLSPWPHPPCHACAPAGKKRNKANVVTFSNKHNRKWQYPNLQHKKVYWPEGQRWVKLRICTKAIKTIEKKGLDAMAKEAGIDLWKLPFEDARPERLAYLEANKGVVPVVSGSDEGVEVLTGVVVL